MFEHVVQKGCRECASQVWSPFTPVQTTPDDRTISAPWLPGDAEVSEVFGPCSGQVRLTVGEIDETPILERIGEADRKCSCKVVVARSGVGHAGGDRRRSSYLLTMAELEHRLQKRCGLGPGQPVVPVPALRLDRNQAAVEQPAQMFAAGRRRHADVPGEFGHGVGASVEQRIKHGDACCISE